MGEKEGDPASRVIVRVNPKIVDLIPLYLENQKRNASRIVQALQVQDYSRIRTIGHDLKGAAKEQDEQRVREGTEELIHYLERVEITC